MAGAHDESLHEIRLSFGTLRYRVRRSTRAKRLSLRYHQVDGFEVVLPQRTPLREVEPFLHSMEPWIASTLRRHPPRPPSAAPIPSSLSDGARVPFLGKQLTLRLEGVTTSDGRSTVSYNTATDTLHARIDLDTPTPAADLLEQWFRYAAREIIPARATRYANLLGVHYGRIAIKDTRTRWGSCSSKGNLNFSWRLLLAPDEVLDYVIAHEVAHLLHLNHSAAFWATLARIYPTYRIPQRWLREHGKWLAAWPNEPLSGG